LYVVRQTKGIAEFDSETYNIHAVLKAKMKFYAGLPTNVRRQQHITHLRQVSQLKICDFSEETFKGFEVL
jgi:hypothetical protein